MSDDRPRYLSYLLRLWQVKGRQGWTWQASLESPTTRKRQGFHNIDSLMNFIQGQTQQPAAFEQTISGESHGSENIEE